MSLSLPSLFPFGSCERRSAVLSLNRLENFHRLHLDLAKDDDWASFTITILLCEWKENDSAVGLQSPASKIDALDNATLPRFILRLLLGRGDRHLFGSDPSILTLISALCNLRFSMLWFCVYSFGLDPTILLRCCFWISRFLIHLCQLQNGNAANSWRLPARWWNKKFESFFKRGNTYATFRRGHGTWKFKNLTPHPTELFDN